MKRVGTLGKVYWVLGFSIGASGAVSAIAPCAAKAAGVNVTVMDGGADLSHSKFQGLLNINAAEAEGKPDFDDDGNQFVDDVLGWNAVSGNAEYMPPGIVKLFRENKDSMLQVVQLYNGVERGDSDAIEIVKSNPQISAIVSSFLNLSHGTHVSGLVAGNSGGSARLQNVNLFSATPKGAEVAPSFVPGLRLTAGVFDRMRETIRGLRPRAPVARAPKFQSIFDKRPQVDAALAPLLEATRKDAQLYVSYLTANRSRVVNLSIGESMKGIFELVGGVWMNELKEAGLKEDTQPNAVQKQNLVYAVETVWKARVAMWKGMFAALPNTLFVVAASNDGQDLEKFPTLPAQLGKQVQNMIVVAATDQDGIITDFSNYNPEMVSLGAWGRAVPSYAPGDIEELLMSGTSMAAPIVSGVASGMLEANSKLTPAELRRILEGTVKTVGSLQGKVSSGGMLNASMALDAATRSVNFPVEDAIRMAHYYGDTPSKPLFDWKELPQWPLPSLSDGTEGRISSTPDVIKDLIRRF